MHQNWKKTVVKQGCSLRDVIESLNNSALQICLVVDDNHRLVGTVTDGDIRRGILKGLYLSDRALNCINNKPLVIPPNLPATTIIELMRANVKHQIPVVDADGILVGLECWDNVGVSSAVDGNTLVIMAGGKGTRLRPFTENCPKPMLEVAGKPMLLRIIEKAKHEGFSQFVIALNYLGHMIEEYFGDGSSFGVTIDYLNEDEPLGTAGALSLLPDAPAKPIVITNGDILTDVNFSELLEFHKHNEAACTMAVRRHEIQNPFGVVMTEGLAITGFEEKPTYHSYINAGVYVLSPEVVISMPKNQYCDMPTLFKESVAKGTKAIVYPMHEQWLDVGRPSDYQLANETHAL